MRTQLNKIAMAAGFGLAMTFSLSSCSSVDDENIPKVQCPEGSTWNASALACASAPVAGSGCPDNTTLAVDGEGKAICVWQQENPETSSPSGNSSSSVGGTTTESMWITYTDKDDDGTSTITKTEEGSSVTVSGNLVNISGSDWGFVGWSTTDASLLAKARDTKYTSITFKVKGDGKEYKVQFVTSDITNYDYYTTTFKTTTGTENITLCLADFKQGGWDSNQKKPFTREEIEAIEFIAHTGWTEEGAFGPITISNVNFGTGTCTSSTPTPTPTPSSSSVQPPVGTGTLVRPWWWWDFTDKDAAGGTSTVDRCGIGPWQEGYEDVADGVTVFKGNVAKMSEGYGFAFCVFDEEVQISDDAFAIDLFKPLTANSTISFKAKGTGKYRLQFQTSDVDPDAGVEHFVEFTVSATEQTFTYKVSDFKQPDWTPAGKEAELKMNNIKRVQLQAHTDNIIGSFSLELRDLRVTQ